jgi:hypothetical protein
MGTTTMNNLIVTNTSTSTFAGPIEAPNINITGAGTSTFSNVSITGTTKLDNLTGVLKASAGYITASLVDLATEVTGFLGVTNGGTGRSDAPTYGKLLVGNNLGGYDFMSTSTIGLVTSESDPVFTAWTTNYYATTTHANITTLPKLLITSGQVSDLWGTSTTFLTEGTNLFWTNDRFNNALNATSSIGTITTLDGLILPASQISGLAAAETDPIFTAWTTSVDGYYATTTHANITTLPKLLITSGQVSDLWGTSTNFLTEGDNLFYTDGRVDARLNTSDKGYFFSTVCVEQIVPLC